MPDGSDHLRDLHAELDRLRGSLVELRTFLPSTHGSASPRPAIALESAHRQLNSIKALVRLLQTDLAATQTRLDRAEQEAWDHKVKRADATARLKNRENLLEQIQRSAAWRAVKPLWKLFHRSRKSRLDAKEIASDQAHSPIALDLPKEWKTNREILLIKGWCFSRSGKAIAGVRAKIGRKGRLGRYGLERPDVVRANRDWPAARRSGFTIEVAVPRGISTVCNHGMLLPPELQALDGFNAANYLRAQPNVGGKPIGVIGFSHGGWAVLKAVLADMASQTAVKPFAAAVAFYPECDPPRSALTTDTLILIGEADDWTPVDRCARWRDSVERNGHGLQMKTYPGALHAFDAPSMPTRA